MRESSFLGAYFFVVVVGWVFGASFGAVLFVENKVLANFCFALSSGVTIGFLGFIYGWIKVFGIYGDTLGFYWTVYYFFLNS